MDQSSDRDHEQTLFERFSNALVYVIFFPFIAMFIGMKRVIMPDDGAGKSYRSRLPVGKRIG